MEREIRTAKRPSFRCEANVKIVGLPVPDNPFLYPGVPKIRAPHNNTVF